MKSISIGSYNYLQHSSLQTFDNLFNNAFYAVNEKKSAIGKDLPGFQNLVGLETYEPTVLVSTNIVGTNIEIRVSDNGNGILQKILDKIFQPFFTTKTTGQGTGLGLSLSYDIVKAHGGELKVETKVDGGNPDTIGNEVETTFIILWPVI